MIFSIGDHIEQIKNGTKTQTRRIAKEFGPYYQEAKKYGISPGRRKTCIPDGVIRITSRSLELRQDKISTEDALAEGGYTPEEYEALFERMYPNWRSRYAYKFVYLPNSSRNTTS